MPTTPTPAADSRGVPAAFTTATNPQIRTATELVVLLAQARAQQLVGYFELWAVGATALSPPVVIEAADVTDPGLLAAAVTLTLHLGGQSGTGSMGMTELVLDSADTVSVRWVQ